MKIWTCRYITNDDMDAEWECNGADDEYPCKAGPCYCEDMIRPEPEPCPRFGRLEWRPTTKWVAIG